MVKIASVVLALTLTFSCESIFDSYFPNTVEFLEQQVDVKALVEGGDFARVQLRYVQTKFLGNLLVAVVFTTDGKAQVLFFDAGSLTLKKKIGDSELRAANSGSMPDLGLIGESWFYAVVVGEIGFTAAYVPVKVNLTSITTNFGEINQTRLSSDFTINQDFVVGSSGSPLGYKFISGNYNALPGTATNNNLAGVTTTPSIVDFRVNNGIYYLCLSDYSGLYYGKGNGIGSISLQFSVVNTNSYSVVGYVTARGLVVQDRSGNYLKLKAYDQFGGPRDELSLKVNNEITAFDVQHDGEYWYMFSSSSGKISRMKAWW